MTDLDTCWMTAKTPRVLVQLGRFGDIIQMLPAFKAMKDRMGENPILVVSGDYASVLEGVSYVTPWIVPLSWPNGTAAARGIAQVEYPEAISLQFWNDAKSQFASEVSRQARILQCHGENWCVDTEKYPDYGTAMWVKAGFTREDMLALPLVFDRRDTQRETELARLWLHPTRPNLLVNWSGISSPFPWVPEYQRVLSKYRSRFNFVDISNLRATRIYDLLGLYDRAVGLLTIDTATLHLAPASKVAYVSFTRRDWSRSVPKGNCILDIGYNEGQQRLPEFERVLQTWPITQMKLEAPFATARGGGVAVFR